MRAVVLLLWALLACPAGGAPALQAVADGIYVIRGEAGAPSAANRGRIANVGIIVGPRGVVVVGTGTSAADGEDLLAAIARLTRLPVVLAINTHAGPEHVLGNGAFARRGIPILAHRATDAYMAAHCALCLARLRDQVGAGALAGTRAARPTRLIDGATSWMAGGRRLEILHFGATPQAGSIAVFDPASGVLFAGGLASFDAVPDARDADLPGWIAALDRVRRLPPKAVVPASGPVGGPERLAETGRYLADLEREIRRAYGGGVSLFAAQEAVELGAYRGWALYEENHRRNVHSQYLRLEARDFGD